MKKLFTLVLFASASLAANAGKPIEMIMTSCGTVHSLSETPGLRPLEAYDYWEFFDCGVLPND